MARKFPLPLVKKNVARSRWGIWSHDDASTDRTALPDLRYALQVAAGDLDELVRWKADGLSRTRCRDSAPSLPDPHVQPLWLFGGGAGFHRGNRRERRTARTRLERARPADLDRRRPRIREVRSRGEGGRVAGVGRETHRRPPAASRLVLRRRVGHGSRAILPAQ